MRIILFDSPTVRVGPIHVSLSDKGQSPSSEVVTAAAVTTLLIYLFLFYWLSQTAIVRIYPTGYTNVWFGLLHGYFAFPSFITSWFNHDVSIYQSPNDGFWYNLGYVCGTFSFLALFVSKD